MRLAHRFLSAMLVTGAVEAVAALTWNAGVANDFRNCAERFAGVPESPVSRREALCLDGGAQTGFSGTILTLSFGAGALAAAGSTALRKKPSP
jgi:hypothetical protein